MYIVDRERKKEREKTNWKQLIRELNGIIEMQLKLKRRIVYVIVFLLQTLFAPLAAVATVVSIWLLL